MLTTWSGTDIEKIRISKSARKSSQMTREDSPGKVATMTTHEVNHTPPLSALATTPMEETANVFDERGDMPPPPAHVDTTETPSSQNGTLKAKHSRRPQRQNGSLKGPWGRMHKESSLPAVKADTVKVLEMYLKRRSKSLNDAVLTREYFAQERKRKDRNARNNTVSICSTISTDSAASEAHAHVHAQTRMEVTVECADSSTFSRKSVTQHSFHQAMKHLVMEDSSTMEQSADDELSSSDEDNTPRSKSAPSTLRMQIKKDTKEELEVVNLRERENGTATLTRDTYKRDSKKEPKRKRSFLDKARHIIRSPSTSRKYDDKDKEKLKEKEKEKERQKEEKEREKLKEKEREKERQREKERLKELKERLKEEKEKEKEKEKDTEGEGVENDSVFARNSARKEVHCEMKKTGFTARLKQTFSRPSSRKSSRDRHRDHDQPKSKGGDVPPPPTDSHASKETKSKRWPSFQFRRRTRKSASTPTDESGACGTPSDTASMDFESYVSIVDHTRSLNDAERRKLLVEINRGGVKLRNSGNASDSQLLDNAPSVPVLSQASSRDSFGSFASSEGSERRPERPQSLIFRRTRAERASRGLNNVIRLDNTTPGHVRRDIGTGEAIFSVPLALVADDLVRDGGASSRPAGREDGADRDERNQTDSWTESGDGSDIPFEQRAQSEQEQFFKRIADRLAQIGDQALADYDFAGDSSGASSSGVQKATRTTCHSEALASCSATATTGAAGPSMQEIASGFEAIGIRIRTDVDSIQQPRGMRQPMFPAQMVVGVVQNNKSYQTFCDTMQSIVGQDIGWEQLALVFKFTKVAVKVAHSMGKRASSIKDNSVRYIGDRFAVWLDSQGGWGSVVTSDDSDSLHEESEID